jgi:hypothetical protein
MALSSEPSMCLRLMGPSAAKTWWSMSRHWHRNIRACRIRRPFLGTVDSPTLLQNVNTHVRRDGGTPSAAALGVLSHSSQFHLRKPVDVWCGRNMRPLEGLSRHELGTTLAPKTRDHAMWRAGARFATFSGKESEVRWPVSGNRIVPTLASSDPINRIGSMYFRDYGNNNLGPLCSSSNTGPDCVLLV